MKRGLHRSDYFLRDFTLQHRWYLENAGENVASRYVSAVQVTLEALIAQPGLGRQRNFRHPALRGIHSFRVQPPFEVHLVFYHYTERELFLERLMHGRRSLPHRLTEAPNHPSD